MRGIAARIGDRDRVGDLLRARQAIGRINLAVAVVVDEGIHLRGRDDRGHEWHAGEELCRNPAMIEFGALVALFSLSRFVARAQGKGTAARRRTRLRCRRSRSGWDNATALPLRSRPLYSDRVSRMQGCPEKDDTRQCYGRK